MKGKQIITTIVISAATAVLSVWGYSKFATSNTASTGKTSNGIPANYANFFGNDQAASGPVDFTPAANAAVPAVAHITTKITSKQTSNNLPRRKTIWEDLFGDDLFDQRRSTPGQLASGSGVFVSEDGFVITNNHVIEGADEIEVTLSNKKKYKAKLIGADPGTDLAVLKVEGRGFPYLVYGNSDDTKLGQWVLAIGYPLNLETTVTAGIVSAKGRMLGLNYQKSAGAIESYIQTDAAVNRGNSGGALINTKGELIGINSAIASPTNAYAGYSYAIPINLAKKIVNDLMKYGNVQRAYLGISPDEQKISDGGGAYIGQVAKEGAAYDAGIKSGDVITKINGVTIDSWNELQASVASYKVGDKIALVYLRDGKAYTVNAVLKNKVGTYELVKNDVMDKLGAELATVDPKKADEYGIDGGVIVKKLTKEGLLARTGIRQNFVIIKINNTNITSLEQLKSVLERADKNAIVTGIYPGYEGIYQYPIWPDEEEE
jgi:serine protease Do